MSSPPSLILARDIQIFPTDTFACLRAGCPGALFIWGGHVRWLLALEGTPEAPVLITRLRNGALGKLSVAKISETPVSDAQWRDDWSTEASLARGGVEALIAVHGRLEEARAHATETWTSASIVWRRWRPVSAASPSGIFEILLQHRGDTTWSSSGGSNELGFVGGRRDSRDRTPLDTALGEMREEMYGGGRFTTDTVVQDSIQRRIIFTLRRDTSVVFVVQGSPPGPAVRGACSEVSYATFPTGHVWWAPGDMTHGISVWRLVTELLPAFLPPSAPLVSHRELYHGTPSRTVADSICAHGFRPSVRGPGHPAACSSCKSGGGYAGSPGCRCLMLGGPAVYLSPDISKAGVYAGKEGAIVQVRVNLGWCKELHGTRDELDYTAAWISQGYDSIHMTSGTNGREEYAIADPHRIEIIGIVSGTLK